MSALVITLRRNADDEPMQLIVTGPTIATTFAAVDGVDEFLLGDVIRHVDRIAFGENPGPCERWIARTEQGGEAA